MSRKKFDITILTEAKYVNPKEINAYNKNILLEDELIGDALKSFGLRVNRVAWDDPNFDWGSTEYSLFRTTWDYFERFEEFTIWSEKAATLTTFINSQALINWNIDKHYLQELKNKGVAIAKTLFIEPGEQINLLQAIQKAKATLGFNSDEFVLKPCIAAGARHTYRFHYTDWEVHNDIFQKLISDETMMLQEFQKNIVNEGEVSMMLFDGVFTHAVIKKAKEGDFRVQDDYGGTVALYEVSKEQIEFAEAVVRACPELPMYARVDIFNDNEGLLALAELEVFEPELWFRLNTEAANIFARSIHKKLFT